MSDKIEIQGKTVEAAVSEALLQMGARRDEVEIKVLEEPKSGFMGFLGGRAARVLVRKKRSRRGGGRDHRVDDGDYQAHNLGNGRGPQRRGSPRRPSGDKPKESNDSRQASRQPEREEKSGSRRGSRGRGGRGRSQGASTRDQKPDQKQDQRPGQRSDQRSGQKPGQRSEQRAGQRSGQRPEQRSEQKRGPKSDQNLNQKPNQTPDQTPDQKPNQKQAQASDRKPDKRRGRPGLGSGRKKDQTRTPRERTKPAAAAREDSTPREEVPIRPLRQEPVQASPAPVAPVVHEETKPITPKEEVTVSKPVKQRRVFGGLGSRLKKKQDPSQAPEAENQVAEGPSAASAPRTVESTPSTPAAPSYERRPRERRTPSYGSAHGGEELVLGDIKGTKYAKRIDAVTEEGLDEALTELTDALLARAGFPCQCETFPGEYRQIKVTTDEDNAGMLIGRHGQTVDAVEHLVERMASNAIDARARINLDINDYRMRREEMLGERVAEVAEKIRETGRPFHMEPMSGRERRIVHLETEALDGLRTFTMDGSGGKHVVIALEEEASQDEEVAGDEPVVDHPSEGVDELNDSDT